MAKVAWIRAFLLGLAALTAGCGGEAPAPSQDSGGAGGAAPGAGSGGLSAGAAGANSGGSSSGAGGSGGNVVTGGNGGSTAGAAGSSGAGPAGGSGGAGGTEVDHDASGVIVVLGSSTAAGSGPKDPANAWVARYTTYLASEFPNFTLTNLAQGGYTTFKIQPTGYTPPEGLPTPDSARNITAALALNPDAIIVNMPSNDQANYYTLEDQLANYERVAALAAEHGALLWVSTTQPRNFSDANQLTALMDARGAISDEFGDHTLDFWTTFAEANGTIKPAYNSGDGTHLNDEAHGLLADIVIAAKIPESIVSAQN